MDELEDLLALLDGVAIGEDEFEIEAQALGGFFGGGGLLDLVVIVLRDQREDKEELFHRVSERDHTAV